MSSLCYSKGGINLPKVVAMSTSSPASVGALSMDAVFKVVLADYKEGTTGRVTLSRRKGAQPIRYDIDDHLADGCVVEVDCVGADATQSFMDELVGILVLERGPQVLSRLRFRGCSKDMKAIINFVVSDRAEQFLRNPHMHAPR